MLDYVIVDGPDRELLIRSFQAYWDVRPLWVPLTVARRTGSDSAVVYMRVEALAHGKSENDLLVIGMVKSKDLKLTKRHAHCSFNVSTRKGLLGIDYK